MVRASWSVSGDQKVTDVNRTATFCVATAGSAADRPPEEEAALL